MPPKEKGLTLEEIMGMNRKERRKIKKATGVMLPGTTMPHYK